MLQRISPWLAAGLTTGLVIIFGIWLMAIIYLNTFMLGYRSAIDQKLVSAVVKICANNPEVQAAVKKHIIDYFKSPEGKEAMVELLKSPEITKAMAENLQSPQMRAAVLKMMQVPEFRQAVLQIIKDTPQMRLLNALSSAIVWGPENNNGKQPAPASSQ